MFHANLLNAFVRNAQLTRVRVFAQMNVKDYATSHFSASLHSKEIFFVRFSSRCSNNNGHFQVYENSKQSIKIVVDFYYSKKM